jgi:hypothetical protein
MLSLEEAASQFCEVMSSYPGYWGVAGGWALDLFLNRKTREHGDLEIVALRRDHEALFRQLAPLGPSQIFPEGPVFKKWHGEPFHQEVIQLRMEHRATEPDFDVLLTPAEGDD